MKANRGDVIPLFPHGSRAKLKAEWREVFCYIADCPPPDWQSSTAQALLAVAEAFLEPGRGSLGRGA